MRYRCLLATLLCATCACGDGTEALEPTPTPTPSPVASMAPTPEVIATPTPTPTPEPSAEPTPDATPAPSPLFDMPRIADAALAECEFTPTGSTLVRGIRLQAFEVRYRAYESIDGRLTPIEIQAYAAHPTDSGSLAGVVVAHGLGGWADAEAAESRAADLRVFALAYSGPGSGPPEGPFSEGHSADHEGGYRMFDTLGDPRGSWFWGHAVAGMRGLTCLATRPEVDAERLGMTGYSAGGVATLMSAGVDARIKAAVPMSGTGAWGLATQVDAAWQNGLLREAGLTRDSEEYLTLLETIDPAVLVRGARAAVLMLNGSTDEFFPLVSHRATFDAIGADADGDAALTRRTSLAANFDHGCYALTGIESAGDIEARRDLRYDGGLRWWMAHWLDSDVGAPPMPEAPTASLSEVAGGTMVEVEIDPGGDRLIVEDVRLWASTDHAWLFGDVELDALPGSGGTRYGKLLPVPPMAHTVWFVDVQYRGRDLLRNYRFSLSSAPHAPIEHPPRIRSADNCQ